MAGLVCKDESLSNEVLYAARYPSAMCECEAKNDSAIFS